ncbi:hypothetical protein [Pandoraea sputorum]
MKKATKPFVISFPLMAFFCVLFYLFGYGMSAPVKKVAIVEKGAVVLEAALDRQGLSEQQLKAQVGEPIKAVLQKYQKKGFVVIDVSRNDEGDMTVAALPSNTLDITNELRAAVHLPPQQVSVGSTAPREQRGDSHE